MKLIGKCLYGASIGDVIDKVIVIIVTSLYSKSSHSGTRT